jgi:hypothetical protein
MPRELERVSAGCVAHRIALAWWVPNRKTLDCQLCFGACGGATRSSLSGPGQTRLKTANKAAARFPISFVEHVSPCPWQYPFIRSVLSATMLTRFAEKGPRPTELLSGCVRSIRFPKLWMSVRAYAASSTEMSALAESNRTGQCFKSSCCGHTSSTLGLRSSSNTGRAL